MGNSNGYRSEVLDALKIWRSRQTPDRAGVLLRGLTDLYISEMKYLTSSEGDLLGRMMHHLLPEVSSVVRAELASNIAPVRYFPRIVIHALACDPDISVAGPVIGLSPEVEDRVLCEIVRDLSHAHMLAVAQRVDVREMVSQMIVHTGKMDLLLAVVGNSGARFSLPVFRKLAETSKKSKKLQAALVRRSDVPPNVACLLEPFLSPELKKELNPAEEASTASIFESLRELQQMAAEVDTEKGAAPAKFDKRAG